MQLVIFFVLPVIKKTNDYMYIIIIYLYSFEYRENITKLIYSCCCFLNTAIFYLLNENNNIKIKVFIYNY